MKHLALALAGLSLTWTAFASPSVRAGIQEAPVAAAPSSNSKVTPLVSKVQLIGASITAGFGNAKELKLGNNTPLAKFLGAAWADRNQGAKFSGAGSNGFFLAPQATGSSQVAKALASSPTLVIALDFLFWYGFGNVQPSTPRRAAGLAQGLKELEAFECPLIIGTLPNVDHALKGVGPLGGPVIFPSQIPTESARKAMNEMILAWAAAREHVQVVDVDGIFAALVAGEALSLRGQAQENPGLTSSLQKDLLHLNLEGYVWTALALCDAAAKFDGAEADDFIFSAAKIRTRFLASVAESQAKEAERTAKRLAREAARKAARKEALRDKDQ